MWLPWYHGAALFFGCGLASWVVGAERRSAERSLTVLLMHALGSAAAPSASVRARRLAIFEAVLRETAVLAGLYTLWRFAGRLSVIQPERAFERADQLWDLQRVLHIPNEQTWQEMILGHDWLVQAANLYYGGAHVPGMGVFLVWLFFRQQQHYRPWRNALAASTILCVLVQLFPVAPPRLMPEFGLVDTPHLFGQSVYPAAGASLSGQLQAMPSIHVGWAVLIGWATLSVGKGWVRWVGVLHAALTAWVVVVTGNHYWLDGVVAAIILAVCLFIARVWDGRFTQRVRSFFTSPPPGAPSEVPARVSAAVALGSIAVVLVAFVGGQPAAAHTDIVGSSPAPESVHAPPFEQLSIQFDQPVQMPEITLLTPDGVEMTGTISSPKPGRLDFVPAGVVATEGTWTLVWSVEAADGDNTNGQFPFEVASAGAVLEPLDDSLGVRSTPVGVFVTDEYQSGERSRWFFVSLGVTLGLALVTVWVFLDWLRERRGSKSATESATE